MDVERITTIETSHNPTIPQSPDQEKESKIKRLARKLRDHLIV